MEELVIGKFRGERAFELGKWAKGLFEKYEVELADIFIALHYTSMHQGYYNTDQKIMHGVRDNLKGMGYKVPMRVGRYKTMEELENE